MTPTPTITPRLLEWAEIRIAQIFEAWADAPEAKEWHTYLSREDLRAWLVAEALKPDELLYVLVPVVPDEFRVSAADDRDWWDDWRASEAWQFADTPPYPWRVGERRLWSRVAILVARAAQGRERGEETERCPTLEAWLGSLHAGRVWSRAPQEPKGVSLMETVEQVEALETIQRRLRAGWPRLCRDCHEEFKPGPDQRANAVRCPNCVVRRKGGARA
jgi:hypothetical protein